MSKILLLSIRPQYAEKIFSGDKTVELRRTRPRLAAGDLVLVYTSSPRCALTGAFLVESVESGTPGQIWKKVGARAGIEPDAFKGYFDGTNVAFAIGIERAWTFDRPVTLNELRRRMAGFHPPQSYRYFPSATACCLIAENGAAEVLSPPPKKIHREKALATKKPTKRWGSKA